MIKFDVKRVSFAESNADLLVFLCDEKQGDKVCSPYIKNMDKLMSGALSRKIADMKFTGKAFTAVLAFTAGVMPMEHLLFVGMGKRKKIDARGLLIVGSTIAKAAKKVGAKNVAIHVDHAVKLAPPIAIKFITEGILLGDYDFDKYKTADNTEKVQPADHISFFCKNIKGVQSALNEAKISASAVCLARDWTNMPSCDATPNDLAAAANKLADDGGLECEILGKGEIKKEGMNCLLAVAKGSKNSPTFIRLDYIPKKKSAKHVILVGKGITFDSGGISLKSPNGMQDMKGDMAGGATVLAVLGAASKLKMNIRLTGIIPCAENMPDAGALKPGDVINARNGKTVEIISTDAEGRLVLADALSYASDIKPDVIIDLATLTGGAVYCCGELFSLVMGNDDHLVDNIVRSSSRTGEYAWKLPMVEEYLKGYKSGIADLLNSGKSKAQTISGGLFLKEFVTDTKWAHMDIAASSWTSEATALSTKGATGEPVLTLIEFLKSYKG